MTGVRFELCEMSIQMRDVLLDHVDGSAPYSINHHLRNHSIEALHKRGYVSFYRCSIHHPREVGMGRPARPRETFITDAGRRALAAVLADAADILVRANAFVEERRVSKVAEKPRSPTTTSRRSCSSRTGRSRS